MWPVTTFTILFRGLLVIHRVKSVHPNYFEVGVVPDTHHFPRIHTIKNGVLAATAFLPEARPSNPIWRLDVEQPVATGVSAYTQGTGKINRKNHSNDKDFRWLLDLGEVFNDIENKLDTTKLFPVIAIPQGIFSTRLKTPELSKVVNGGTHEFGFSAAVVACDIPIFAGTGVRLNEQESGNLIFDFEQPDENTMYEFANTPCDVPAHKESNGEHMEMTSGEEEESDDVCAGDHFRSYYNLLRNPRAEQSICFVKVGPRPAPDPALCGAVGGGDIEKPFGSGGGS